MQHNIKMFNHKNTNRDGFGMTLAFFLVLSALATIVALCGFFTAGPYWALLLLTWVTFGGPIALALSHVEEKMNDPQRDLKRIYESLPVELQKKINLTPQIILDMEINDVGIMKREINTLHGVWEQNQRASKAGDVRIASIKERVREEIAYLTDHTEELKKQLTPAP